MRWFWQRRRPKQEVATATRAAASMTAPDAAAVQRAPTTSGRLGQPRQLTSDLLAFARDYLQAAGARVRVEDEDVLSATLADGTLVRYTTTLAKARADESATLLVEGSEALANMLDDIARHARQTALQLPSTADPIALALAWCAAPNAQCGHCLTSQQYVDDTFIARCETCPLREGQSALRWQARGQLTGRLVQQESATAVELAYLVASRDRQGRRDEWLRYAVDTTSGHQLPALSEEQLATGEVGAPPPNRAKLLETACAAAESAIGPQLTAIGGFLRQRAANEYLRRRDEVRATFDRLQREVPEEAHAAKAASNRELAALAEVYAIDVEAQLESACFITTPVATVAIRPAKGKGELLLRVDTGRQAVLAPLCAQCGDELRAGFVCDFGHPLCVKCAAACAKCGAWQCAICAGAEATTTICANCGTPRPAVEVTPTDSIHSHRDGMFAVEQLEALPPGIWLMAVEWLLGHQGIATESRRQSGEIFYFQGISGERKAEIAVLRQSGPFALDATAVRQIAAHLGSGQINITRILLTPTPATADARAAAQQLDVALMDRHELQTLLSGLASAYERERSSEEDENQLRADAAGRTQKSLIDVLDAADKTLAPLKRARKTSAQAVAGPNGVRTLTSARMSIERVSLAWETLLADWSATFGERATRTGRLALLAETSRYDAMIERASHLRTAMLDALTSFAGTPARGETSYEALRRAILDESSARLESWRWRVRTVDPAHWQDFDRAWNAQAAAKAAEATTAAGHATARADKAQSQIQRAG